MKRILTAVLVGVVSLTIAGCNGGGQASGANASGNSQQEGKAEEVATVSSGNPEDVLASMQADFNDTAQAIHDEQVALFKEVGESFEDYSANVELIQEWYAFAVSETEALGERTQANSRVYFQSVIDTVDPNDRDALSDAIEAYYDAIYDDAYGDYYDAVYEDIYKAIYDQYHDGILNDAFDTEEYGVVSDARSAEYENWSDSRSDVYEAISDARSEIYDISSDAWSAYYDDEFVIDEIFRESVVNVQE